MVNLTNPPELKTTIRGDSGDSWPVWNRGITYESHLHVLKARAVYLRQDK